MVNVKKTLEELSNEIAKQRVEITKLGLSLERYQTYLARQRYLFEHQGKRFHHKYPHSSFPTSPV